MNTSTAAWDGAVDGGAPRTSTGTATCTAGTGDCQVQSVSHASTGSGAALALAGSQTQAQADGLAGQEQGINTARLTAGPSAASAAGAALICEGEAVVRREGVERGHRDRPLGLAGPAWLAQRGLV